MLEPQIGPVAAQICFRLFSILKRDVDPAHVASLGWEGEGGKGGEGEGARMNFSGLWLRMGSPQYVHVWSLYLALKLETGIVSSFRREEEAISASFCAKAQSRLLRKDNVMCNTELKIL